MLAKIQKWGNSQGLRLTKNVLADAQLEVGDEVDIRVKDGILTVTPAKRIRGRHNLEELVARIPENYRSRDLDWGDPVGWFNSLGVSDDFMTDRMQPEDQIREIL